jgi:probable phosphoglycerate mutase
VRIAISCDHAGFALGRAIAAALAAWGHEAVEVGPPAPVPGDDYPERARELAATFLAGRAERGVLVCGSGAGVSIAANKLPGVYSAVCHDSYSAHQAVEHDGMNALALGARVVGESLALEIVRAFVDARVSDEERHRRRRGQILALEAARARSGEDLPEVGRVRDERPRLFVVRHGETEWSRAGRHTGRTDLPLTPEGERQAIALVPRLAGSRFALVLTSPLRRARDTCRLAGFGDVARVEPDLAEWDYGSHEGKTSSEIDGQHPGWTIWTGPVPGGETPGQVAARADRVIAAAVAAGGDALLFAHGHLLRVLAARWLGLEPAEGRRFGLDPATIGILGHERAARVVRMWNAPAAPQR